MFVIGLTGLAASGKTTVANYLKKYGFEFLIFSDILKKEAEKTNILSGKSYEEQKDILSRMGNKLRDATGNKGILAEMMVKEIMKRKLDRVVIDGFRSKEEVEIFKNNFKNFHLFFIYASPELRFRRRCIEDGNTDERNFMNRDMNDLEEKGLRKVIDMAGFKINNNGNFDNLYNQVDLIIKKIY